MVYEEGKSIGIMCTVLGALRARFFRHLTNLARELLRRLRARLTRPLS